VSWSRSALRTLRVRGVPSAENDALARGMAMVAVPVVFGFLGSLLDGAVGTAVVFTILFAAFGVACSFTAAYYRYERSIAEHEAGKPWTRTREVRRLGGANR